jgi:uncharacterized protein (DUF1330 family)
MRTQIKTALTLTVGVFIGAIGFGALRAQTNAPMAYWVTETLETTNQAAFMNAIKAVPPTLQPYGGRYIALGGRILPGEGSPPKRITIVAFDSFDKARQWVDDPRAAAVRAEAAKYATSRNYTVEGATAGSTP